MVHGLQCMHDDYCKHDNSFAGITKGVYVLQYSELVRFELCVAGPMWQWYSKSEHPPLAAAAVPGLHMKPHTACRAPDVRLHIHILHVWLHINSVQVPHHAFKNTTRLTLVLCKGPTVPLLHAVVHCFWRPVPLGTWVQCTT
jgi:hypothetical protein